MARGWLAGATALAMLFVVSGAHAASVGIDGDKRTFTAGGGEVNALVISRASDGELEFRDLGASVSAPAGCSQPDSHTVRCPDLASAKLQVYLGDGDDSFELTAGVALPLTARGGDGVDTMTAIGGGRSVRLVGEAGADQLSGTDVRLEGDLGADHLDAIRGEMVGGAGADVMHGLYSVIDYTARTGGVHVDLEGDADDGEPGERDRVTGTASALLGGSGADVLVGGGGAGMRLVGGAGADRFVADADIVPSAIVDYSAHTVGVRVSADGVANDGAPGEGDDVGPRLQIRGTEFADEVFTGAEAIGVAAVGVAAGGGDDAVHVASPWCDCQGYVDFDGGAGHDLYDSSLVTTPQHLGYRVVAAFEEIVGGAGDDTIEAVAGVTAMYGGPGNDRLVETTASATTLFAGGAGQDTVDFTGADASVRMTVDGMADDGRLGEGDNLMDVEVLRGSAYDDVLVGGSTDDVIDGGYGRDVLDGGDGIDLVSYRFHRGVEVSFDDVANDGAPGENDDVRGFEAIFGSHYDDVLRGADGDDYFDGGYGGDVIVGGAGIDVIDYSARGGSLRVTLAGGADDGFAGEHDDVREIEIVFGGFGPDELIGDDADNMLVGGAGSDVIRGGAGVDATSYEDAFGVTVHLATPGGDGEPGEDDDVGPDIEQVLGSPGDDVLVGSTRDEYLDGRGGNDTIRGNAGRDLLIGGDGADEIHARDGEVDRVGCSADRADLDPIDELIENVCVPLVLSGSAVPPVPPPAPPVQPAKATPLPLVTSATLVAPLSAGRLPVSLTRAGVALVTINCPATSAGGCKGTLALVDLGRVGSRATMRRRLISVTVTMAPGTTKRLRVRLPSSARKLFATGARNIEVRANLRDSTGRGVRSVRTLKLQLPARR